MQRRQFLGLAAATGASTSWLLRADALPTPATEDAHQYVHFLQAQNPPAVVPEGKWKPTHPDILGPYHVGGAPFRGKVTPPLEPGELLVIRGRVWSFITKTPLASAVLDVWQADHQGKYDFQHAGGKPVRAQFRNRIRLVTDEEGHYEYETIKPASYRAGEQVRPAHIHYLLQAKGHKQLITQLYFKGDPHLKADPWGSKSPLVIDLQKIKNERGTYLQGVFDLVLDGAA